MKLKEIFLSKLEVKMSKFDFKYIKKYEGFIKKEKDGWKLYQILFLNLKNEYIIKPSLLIRNNIIEDIFHRTSGFDKKYQKDTPTIGIPIEVLKSDLDYRKKLNIKSNIDNLVDFYYKVFIKVGVPFFNDNYSLDSINKIINNDDIGELYTGAIFRGFKNLILTKKMNIDDYNLIEQKYSFYYNQFCNGFYLPQFERLKKDINENVL